jgi:DNA ligase 4
MIMFYYVLFLDNVVCMNKPHQGRRCALERLVAMDPDSVDNGEHEVNDWLSKYFLRSAFAKCVTDDQQGFILNGSEDPCPS